MKLGIDVGGSHIGLGIVDKQGNIILKKEQDYTEKQDDMSLIVINIIKKLIDEAVTELSISSVEIDKIGIAFPRNNIKWMCSKS